MDFSSSEKRFEKAAEKRKLIAKEKQRNEAIARRRQAQLEKERLAQAALRQEELQRQRAAKERREQEEVRLTGGVNFMKSLTAVFMEGEDDKIILPQSSLEILMNQNAFDLGPMCFRIWTSSSDGSGRVTHCGVREFTAAEGTIQIPKKVLDSLGLTDKVHIENSGNSKQEEFETEGGDHSVQQQDTATSSSLNAHAIAPRITLKYVLLSKVNTVRIQPAHNLFAHVGPVKQVLEENLRYHSTLSVGDVLTVYYRGTEHTLTVRDVALDSDKDKDEEQGENEDDGMDVDDIPQCEEKSGDAGGDGVPAVRGGTLINTDVVVDIDVSEEYEGLSKGQQKVEESAGVSTASASVPAGGGFVGGGGRKLGGGGSESAGQSHLLSSSLPSLPPPLPRPSPNTTNASDYKESAREVVLADEPAPSAPGVITCKVKTPQGRTFTRRFEKAKPLRQLFTFVHFVLQTHQLPAPETGEVLQLSTRQPVRRFTEVEVDSGSISNNEQECGAAGRTSSDGGGGDTSTAPPVTFLSAGFESSHELFFVAFV